MNLSFGEIITKFCLLKKTKEVTKYQENTDLAQEFWESKSTGHKGPSLAQDNNN